MYNTIALFGSLLLSSAYILLTLGWLRGGGRTYPAIGALASLCVMIGSIPLGALQPVVFNGIWLIFSLMAILRMPLPRIIQSEKPIWCAAIFLFTIPFVFSDPSSSLTDHALSGAASASITLFVGAYLLFIYKALSERAFYRYNLVANGLFVGLMIQTSNLSVLIIIGVGAVMSLMGLVRLYRDGTKQTAATL